MRKLKSSDLPRIIGLYAKLSKDDRYMRFCGNVGEPAVVNYLSRLPLAEFKDAGIVRGVGSAESLDAVSELIRDGDTMEFAVVVSPTARGKGLATKLLEQAAADAKLAGAKRLILHCLGDNVPMVRSAKRVGMTVRTVDCEREAFLDFA